VKRVKDRHIAITSLEKGTEEELGLLNGDDPSRNELQNGTNLYFDLSSCSFT
jgi:hypothetical protein